MYEWREKGKISRQIMYEAIISKEQIEMCKEEFGKDGI